MQSDREQVRKKKKKKEKKKKKMKNCTCWATQRVGMNFLEASFSSVAFFYDYSFFVLFCFLCASEVRGLTEGFSAL